MTLPTRPNAIISILQGAQKPVTKTNIERAHNAKTQNTPQADKYQSSIVQTHHR